MNEHGFGKEFCPCCKRRCDLTRPGCERGEEFARTGVIPGRGEHGGPPLPPDMPGKLRHYGPAAMGPGGPPPFPGRGMGVPFGNGPHGRGGHGRPPRPPRGKLTEDPRYQQDDTNGKLMALLRVLGHRGHAMEGFGGQNRVLTILKEEGEMTQRALTERLGIQPGSASEIIGKLEKAGYLIRTPGLKDRRTADISLTEAGATRAEEAAEKRETQREEMFAALTEEERETLRELMEKLYNAWAERRP